MSENVSRKKHWAARSRELAPWREAVGWAWLALPKKEREASGVPCNVLVELPFAKGARRDPHNYISTNVKAMIDELVKVGVWPDDNPDWVTVIEPKLVHPATDVKVHLIPRGEDGEGSS